MQITIETPTGVDAQQLAKHLDEVRDMMRDRFAKLKKFSIENGGPQQKKALQEMSRMMHCMPSFNKLNDAVKASINSEGQAA